MTHRNRTAQWGANVSLAATTLADHLRDDPVVLALQLSRRLPVRLRTALADSIGELSPHALDLPASVGLVAAGRIPAVVQRIQRAVTRGAGPAARVRFAEILLAANEPHMAGELLAATPATTAGWAAACSRLHWHEGRLDDAVEVLSSQGGQGRLRARLESERAALTSPGGCLGGHRLRTVEGYRPRPCHVLHVLTNSLPHTGSGYAQRSHSLLLATRDVGWHVEAVTRLGWPVQTGVLHAAGWDVVDGITYHRLLPPRLEPGMEARLAQQAELLLSLVLRRRPAVLHTTTHWANAAVVRAVAEAVGIPWVYEVRGQLADTWASTRGPEARESQRYRAFTSRENEAVCAADGVITLGEHMAARIVEAGVPREEIVLSPNAVGGAFLDAPQGPGPARERLGLDPEAEYVGTVSSVVPYEGLDDMVRAVALLAAARPRLQALVVGDGTALPALRRLANDLGIADRLVTTGRVSRSLAPDYHRALDVFCVPRKDTEVTRAVTPMKPLEAMASGRPTLVSDLPALREIVQDGHTGLVVRAGDPQAWAAAIHRVLTAPTLAADLGASARAWVVEERTWSVNAQRYVQLYDRIGARAR